MENAKMKFEYNWCEYFTPCPYKTGIMIGDYDCSECQHFKGVEINTTEKVIPEGYARYSMVYYGCVNCSYKK